MKSNSMKRNSLILLAILIIATIILASCNKSSNENTSVNTGNNATPKHKNGLLFSTEYEVVDYSSGVFIVSKLDGTLFGALDMKGKELIPLQYDELSFAYGKSAILAKYEGKIGLYNINGKEVLPIKYDLIDSWKDNIGKGYAYTNENGTYQYIGFDMEGNILWTWNNDRAFSVFYLGDSYLIIGKNVVDYNMNVVYTFDEGMSIDEYVSKDSGAFGSVIATGTGWKTVIIDKNLNRTELFSEKTELAYSLNSYPMDIYNGYAIIQQPNLASMFINVATGEISNYRFNHIGKYYNNTAFAETTDRKYAIIDNTGNIIKTFDFSAERVEYLKNTLCYLSNDTWKFIDKDGNSIGDDRYFEVGEIGTNKYEYYAFKDADGNYAVYNQFGKLAVEKGKLIGGENGTIEEKNIINCVSSDDAICFITYGEDGKKDIMWYGAK